MEKDYTVSVLVENNAGVLSRVSGLFSRRGYNIKSLSVGETLDPRYSRMTIMVSGDEYILEQIQKQLAKLVEVVKIVHIPPEESVYRELMMIKVRAGIGTRTSILELCNVFHAKICDLSPTTATVEITGAPGKNNAFLELLEDFGIMEVVRTGIAGIQRGENHLSLEK